MAIIRTVLGALIGGQIDRQMDGRGGIAGAAVGAAAVRLATRSVPGALAVGGAMLAAGLIKKRIDRKRAQRATQGEQLGPIGDPPAA